MNKTLLSAILLAYTSLCNVYSKEIQHKPVKKASSKDARLIGTRQKSRKLKNYKLLKGKLFKNKGKAHAHQLNHKKLVKTGKSLVMAKGARFKNKKIAKKAYSNFKEIVAYKPSAVYAAQVANSMAVGVPDEHTSVINDRYIQQASPVSQAVAPRKEVTYNISIYKPIVSPTTVEINPTSSDPNKATTVNNTSNQPASSINEVAAAKPNIPSNVSIALSTASAATVASNPASSDPNKATTVNNTSNQPASSINEVAAAKPNIPSNVNISPSKALAPKLNEGYTPGGPDEAIPVKNPRILPASNINKTSKQTQKLPSISINGREISATKNSKNDCFIIAPLVMLKALNAYRPLKAKAGSKIELDLLLKGAHTDKDIKDIYAHAKELKVKNKNDENSYEQGVLGDAQEFLDTLSEHLQLEDIEIDLRLGDGRVLGTRDDLEPIAALVYNGVSHYYAYIKSDDNSWYKLNDAAIEKLEGKPKLPDTEIVHSSKKPMINNNKVEVSYLNGKPTYKSTVEHLFIKVINLKKRAT